jgi:hypothetical protein
MADTPFGLSFGNPAKYMGSSGIGEALKTGLTAYALQQSGAVDWLNKQGLSQNSKGKWDFKVPEGAIAPDGATTQAINPNVAAPAPVIPNAVAPTQQNAQPPAEVTVTPIPDVGSKILDNNWHGVETSSVNPQAQRDFNPVVPQTGYNTMLASGNEYQKVPGYGKLAKAFQAFAGGMG